MNIFLKNLLSIFVITIIILSGIIQSESADYLIEDNSISVNEDRSEYFRNEILNNLSKMQILSYLNRKETVEKPSSKELAAKYILNLLPPYDRKLDTAIGNNWDSLSSNEKDALRFEWFQKNKNSVSTRELQTYIAISDLIQKAREAENQRKIRENRHKIDFAQTMSDSQFIMVLEKTIKTIAPKVEPVSAKPVLKEQPSEKSYSKKSKASKP
ncbi:hypothetical protein KA977_08885, partial [Candidatus Dependentiae bacterium]|nr:hypothetical protein [Candidatus Dependentiae bacterium]